MRYAGFGGQYANPSRCGMRDASRLKVSASIWRIINNTASPLRAYPKSSSATVWGGARGIEIEPGIALDELNVAEVGC